MRLKGGDPYVFGRGGEEAESLAENGLDFEVIPHQFLYRRAGVCGDPVTHRDHASSFHVVTGHMCQGMSRRTGMHSLPLTAPW